MAYIGQLEWQEILTVHSTDPRFVPFTDENGLKRAANLHKQMNYWHWNIQFWQLQKKVWFWWGTEWQIGKEREDLLRSPRDPIF